MTQFLLFRSIKWVLLAIILPVVVFLAMFEWNWLRGPIERMVTGKTGRVLSITGELQGTFGWPVAHLRASGLTFANPDWAREKQMLSAAAVDIAIDLPQLLRRHVVFPEVRLERPVVFLEQGSQGRKNWLLDLKQQDEGARIQVGRLTLDHGRLGYDDAQARTSIRAAIDTANTPAHGVGAPGVVFAAKGLYKGQALQADGAGGPVLALRDEATPYPLTVAASLGQTRVRAHGTITGLLELAVVDMHINLRGDNVEQLYPLFGVALPATRAYVTEGHLRHHGTLWRYEKFSGRIGDSDIAGSLQVDRGGQRPVLKAELASRLLDIADLGPLIGARPDRAARAGQARPVSVPAAAAALPTRLLPDLPFKADRWNRMDADVTLKAATIRRPKELPLENLVAHLTLRDSILALDPLEFGLAGGHLSAVIALDGRKEPIQAHARLKARRILVSRLLPTIELNQASIGEVNGEFDLTGSGNSVRHMLATSNGKLGLSVSGGQISKLMMEKVGLHLWEVLELKLTGDRLIKLRCAVADFDVKHGAMHANALILDTEVTTISGTGSIDLAQERLNLTLNQKTKNTSPLALRSPIHIRGVFASPEVSVDKAYVAARAFGAIALGFVSPLLLLAPLIDAGPGMDSDCSQLIREAKAMPQTANSSPTSLPARIAAMPSRR